MNYLESDYRSACDATNRAFIAYRESGWSSVAFDALTAATRREAQALQALENPQTYKSKDMKPITAKGSRGAAIRSEFGCPEPAKPKCDNEPEPTIEGL